MLCKNHKVDWHEGPSFVQVFGLREFYVAITDDYVTLCRTLITIDKRRF